MERKKRTRLDTIVHILTLARSPILKNHLFSESRLSGTVFECYFQGLLEFGLLKLEIIDDHQYYLCTELGLSYVRIGELHKNERDLPAPALMVSVAQK